MIPASSSSLLHELTNMARNVAKMAAPTTAPRLGNTVRPLHGASRGVPAAAGDVVVSAGPALASCLDLRTGSGPATKGFLNGQTLIVGIRIRCNRQADLAAR